MLVSTHMSTIRELSWVSIYSAFEQPILTKFSLNWFVLAIAGKDFVTVATDTRISSGYNILSRDYSKTTKLTDSVVITSGGMVADIETLHKNLLFTVRMYQIEHKKQPTIENLAQKLGNMLYGRRFMPFYAFNLLCGLDKTGKGVVCGYDAIGSWDMVEYGVQGSGSQLGAPILDNQFQGHNYMVKVLPDSQEDVETTAMDIINSIAERDIYTGDGVEVVTVDKNGVRTTKQKIRCD